AVLRRPADPPALVAPPPGHACVLGRAPDHRVPDLTGEHAPLHHAGEVVVGEPGGQHPRVHRLREARADADVDVLHAVLVPVEAAHQLAVCLGQAVIAVRPEVAVAVENARALVEADGVVAAGEDDAGTLAP